MRTGVRSIAAGVFPGLALAVMAGMAMSPGCSGEHAERQAPERLSIAFQSWVGYGPLYLAADKGFFAEEGLELVFVGEELDAARRGALKTGMLDAEAATIDLLVNKRARNTPVVAVAVIDLSVGGDAVVATENIRSLRDLVGKRVALARDNVGETFLSFLFHKAGLDFSKITIMPMAPDEAGQAFLDNEVDAAVTWEPWVTRALARPGAHVLVSSKDEPGIMVDVLSVREDILGENPGVVKKLLSGWYRAVAYYKAHPGEASRVIAPHFKLTPEQYRKQVGGLHWPAAKEALDAFGTGEKPGRLNEVFDTIALIKHKNGRIARRPAAAQALRPEALRALCERGEMTE